MAGHSWRSTATARVLVCKKLPGGTRCEAAPTLLAHDARLQLATEEVSDGATVHALVLGPEPVSLGTLQPCSVIPFPVFFPVLRPHAPVFIPDRPVPVTFPFYLGPGLWLLGRDGWLLHVIAGQAGGQVCRRAAAVAGFDAILQQTRTSQAAAADLLVNGR